MELRLDEKSPPEGDINPQLRKVMNYFTIDNTRLQNLEENPDVEAYSSCELIDFNSFIGSVLNFVVAVVKASFH